MSRKSGAVYGGITGNTKYEVLQGAANSKGLDFELNFCLFLALKFTFNGCLDFKLLRNVKGIKYFDDIIFSVKDDNNVGSSYFFQLKHKGKSESINADYFFKKNFVKVWFNIKSQLDSLVIIEEFCEKKSDNLIFGGFEGAHIVFFTDTTCHSNVSQFPRIKVDFMGDFDTSQDCSSKECTQDNETLHSFKFEPIEGSKVYSFCRDHNKKRADEFVSKFVILTHQKDPQNLYKECEKIVKNEFPRLNTKMFLHNIKSLLNDEYFSPGIVLNSDCFKKEINHQILSELKDVHNFPKYNKSFDLTFTKASNQKLREELRQSEYFCDPGEIKLLQWRFKDLIKTISDSNVVVMETEKVREYQKELEWITSNDSNVRLVILAETEQELPKLTSSTIIYYGQTDSTKELKRLETDLSMLNKDCIDQVLQQFIDMQGESVAGENVVHPDMYQKVKGVVLYQILEGKLEIGGIKKNRDYFIPRSLYRNMKYIQPKYFHSFLEYGNDESLYLLTNVSLSGENNFYLEKNIEFKKVEKYNEISINNIKNVYFTYNSDFSDESKLFILFKYLTERHVNIPLHWFDEKNDKLYVCRSCNGQLAMKLEIERLELPPEVNEVDQIPGKFVPLQGEPGMGKTTIAQEWAKRYKIKYPNNLIIFCPNRDIDYLQNFVFENINDLKCLLNKMLPSVNNNDSFEFLKCFLEMNKRCVIFFDGLDEVDEDYNKQALKLIEYFTLFTKVDKVIVTSRFSIDLDLNSYRLKEFLKNQQIAFLSDKCSKNNPDIPQEQVKSDIEQLITWMDSVIPQDKSNILGIPLQSMIIYEVYASKMDMSKKISLLDLFRKFIEKKVKIYIHEKQNIKDNTHIEICVQNDVFEKGAKVAAKMLTENKDMPTIEVSDESEELLQECGLLIIDKIFNNRFIHKTFAEFLCAHFFKENYDRARYKNCIEKYLFKNSFKIVSLYFDMMLAEGTPLHLTIIHDDFTKFVKVNKNVDTGGRNILHLLCIYNRERMLAEIKNFIKENKDFLNCPDMVLGFTPSDYALKHLNWNAIAFCHELKLFLTNDIPLPDKIKDKDLKRGIEFCVSNLNYGLSMFRELYNKFQNKILNMTFSNTFILNNDGDLSLGPYIASAGLLNIFTEWYNQSNFSSQELERCLFYASLAGKVDIIEFLRSQNVDFVYKTKKKSLTILHVLVLNNNFESLSKFWERYGSIMYSIDEPDEIGNTPLIMAVLRSSSKIVEYLIQHGASVRYKTNREVSVFFHACRRLEPDINILNLLIQNGADINASNVDGVCPLMIVAEDASYDVVKFLGDKIAGTNYKTKKKWTPLHYACLRSKPNLDIIKLLCNNKNINATTDNGLTPLMAAAKLSSFDIVKYLIDNLATVNFRDDRQHTALHYACRRRKPDLLIVEALATAENINVSDQDGVTPLMLAAKNATYDIVAFLVKKGADVNWKDKSGESILDSAEQNSLSKDEKVKIIHLLKDKIE